ncbi:hypothetical protein Q5Y75_21405 [Ruegeria sp. 2205SS24-7]|uniref:hypothetical protein n=1 Tax=Ruegeria discodermiae TaxID=3064389 RepID=UPI002741E3A9|nr:hypothetical protein [Ruegeria sp. 2205SS24-7]MDP5219787.1 hypothetical protein [Ruegeria sp. 2205SS24-7]
MTAIRFRKRKKTMMRRSFFSALSIAGATFLAPQILAADEAIAGSYSVQGRNVEGQIYQGLATVQQDGSFVNFEWRTGSQVVSGAGSIDGRVVTVDWGSEHPVVYVVMADGTLHGTWADGLALDKLTPQ